MLTREPTSEMIAEWKRTFELHRNTLKPNRKLGYEIDRYFREKYQYKLLDNAQIKKVVFLNIMENEHLKSKLPKNTLPNIQCYQSGNVVIGIDLCSGEFHLEGEDVEEVRPIYDDLFVYRGLDEEDLKNFFLVAEYVKLSKK